MTETESEKTKVLEKSIETEVTASRKEEIEIRLKQLGLSSGNWREAVDNELVGMDMSVFN